MDFVGELEDKITMGVKDSFDLKDCFLQIRQMMTDPDHDNQVKTAFGGRYFFCLINFKRDLFIAPQSLVALSTIEVEYIVASK